MLIEGFNFDFCDLPKTADLLQLLLHQIEPGVLVLIIWVNILAVLFAEKWESCCSNFNRTVVEI